MKPTTPIAALCCNHHALGSDKDLSLIQLQHHLITELVQQKISLHTKMDEEMNYAIARQSTKMTYGNTSNKKEA